MAISELHGSGHTGWTISIADDVELALVVQPVVFRAETEQIRRVRAAAMRPVDDVMDLDETIRVATRDPATAVAVFDEAPRAIRHDVL